MTYFSVCEGQRFVMLDFFGNSLDCWQVVHTVAMPSGRQRTTVFNVAHPGDMLDIYADELADPARFTTLDTTMRLDGIADDRLAA